MRRASGGNVRPSTGAGAGSDLWPWLIPAGFALVAAAATAAFLGGRLASGVSGHGFTGPSWRLFGAADLAHHATSWPGVPAGLVWTVVVIVFLILLALVTAPVVLFVHGMRRASTRSAARSMASRTDVATLDTKRAAAVALRLRPSLDGQYSKAATVPAGQRGVTLGKLLPGGRLLQASWEDVIVAIFAHPARVRQPRWRCRRSSTRPVRSWRAANKADLYLATAALREADTGCPGVGVRPATHHAPRRRSGGGTRWVGRMSMDDATRLAGGFIMAVADDQNREIWGPAANELLSNLIFAAYLGRLTLLDVYRWAIRRVHRRTGPAFARPRPQAAAANSLAGTQGLPPETRGIGVFHRPLGHLVAARQRDLALGRPAGRPRRVRHPPRSSRPSETLYLLSKNVAGGTSAASLGVGS